MKYTPEEYEFAVRLIHHREELTDREAEEWMGEQGHPELLLELAYIRMEEQNFCVDDGSVVREQLHRELSPSRRLRLWTMSIAASLVLALGGWLWLRSVESHGPVSQLVQNPIIPGNPKALLILSDGKTVDLNHEVREITGQIEGIIRNDSVEGLKYRTMENSTRLQKEEYNVLQVPVGGFYKLELSDGSRVWLNAGSELRFPVSFGEDERNVYLKGEGYFEVAKDETRRFNVHLNQAMVTVLGTSFNINAYPDEKKISTTLVNGAVRFHAGQNGQDVVLEPGRQCVMDVTTGQTLVREVDTRIYTSWVEGRFVFRFMNLEVIIRQLQRWYDFEISYLSPEIREYEFQGVIQRDSKIEDVFKAIELTTDVRFKINGRQVTVEKR